MPRIAASLSTFSVCDFPHFVGCFYSIFPCRYLDWMYLFLSLLLAGEQDAILFDDCSWYIYVALLSFFFILVWFLNPWDLIWASDIFCSLEIFFLFVDVPDRFTVFCDFSMLAGFQAWTGARAWCRWINAEYCRSHCICKSQNLQAWFHWCSDHSTFRLLGIVGFGNGQELLATIFGEHYILFLAWKKQWILLQMRIGEFCCWYCICRRSQPTTVWCNGSATSSMSVKTKHQI